MSSRWLPPWVLVVALVASSTEGQAAYRLVVRSPAVAAVPGCGVGARDAWSTWWWSRAPGDGLADVVLAHRIAPLVAFGARLFSVDGAAPVQRRLTRADLAITPVW